MRTIRSLISLPVVVNNRKVGRVLQAELSDNLKQLDGLWINSVLFGTRFISSDSIETLGRVSVIADSPGTKKRCSVSPLLRRAVGTDGSRLGAIIGAEIDDLSFQVVSLELSFGMWDDLLNGRRHIRHFTLNRASGDVIVDVNEIEMEVANNEKRHDEGIDHRSCSRRFCRNDVRHHELAICQTDEPADEENRTLARQ